MAQPNRLRITLLALLGVFILTIGMPIPGRGETKEEKKQRERREEQEKKERERAKKEQERMKKEEKRRGVEAKQYANIVEFAQDYYASDPDFHDAVDQAYQDLQGRHALEAFQINTRKTGYIVEADGDELKVRRDLYDNPRIQDYVNRVGQRLVPSDSDKLYAFKVVRNPIPYAYTLSTGTIYISTGLISLTDNEAQLAYVLSHELGHVYKDHWRLKVMAPLAEEEYNQRQERKRALWGAIFAGAGAAIGGAIKGKGGVVPGAGIGALSGLVIGSVLAKKIDVDWYYAQENEADDFALKNTLEGNYDVREVPKLYLALNRVSGADQRAGLGFVSSRKRVKERSEYTQKLLQTTFQAQYEEKLKAGQLVGTSPDYQLMMAELKRDNGIMAFYFDMFSMARDNLRQAVNLRSDDPRARYYYGKVVKLVSRTDADKDLAARELTAAIELDEPRHEIPEAKLQRALMLMDNPDSAAQAQAVDAVKAYIQAYVEKEVREAKAAEFLPPNMDILYDYLRLLGEKNWAAPLPERYRVLEVVRTSAGSTASTDAVAPAPPSSR